MKSLLLLVLLAVLSVRNDAAEIQNLKSLLIPKDTSLADPSSDIPATIDIFIDADEEDVINRANLSVGSIGSGDSQLYRTYFNRGAIANTVQNVNVNIVASSSTRFTAIRATEQGTSQNARATITAGGLGRNTVTIRLSSASGRGFNYLVQVWGR